MKLENLNHLASIAASIFVIFGGGSIVVFWKRITNKKEVDQIKEELAVALIDLQKSEERAEVVVAKLAKFETTVRAFKSAAQANPEVANAVLPFLDDLIHEKK